MKQVIDGTLYNTETAKKLGGWHNDAAPESTYYCEETLYVRRGMQNFFLHGKSGSTGKYATNNGEGWSAGEAIIPLTDYGARMWLKRRAS